eukprot:4638010-Amphidinium_carterae.1
MHPSSARATAKSSALKTDCRQPGYGSQTRSPVSDVANTTPSKVRVATVPSRTISPDTMPHDQSKWAQLPAAAPARAHDSLASLLRRNSRADFPPPGIVPS